MNRRDALRALAGAAGATLAAPAIAALGTPSILRRRFRLLAGDPGDYSERAVRLVRESAVVDLLCQFRFPDFREEGTPTAVQWLRTPAAFTESDFARFRESGVNVLALGRGAPDYEGALRFHAEWNGFVASRSDWFTRVDVPGHLASAAESRKVGIILTTQNSDHFRTPDDVETFFGLGQRVSQLTYNFQNRIGSGFLEHRDGGLTVFGHRILERMERVGMAVDASHCGDRTTLDALDASTRPMVFSHASCRALVPGHLRCKTDEMIRKLAGKGGVMGIPFLRFLIRPSPPVGVDHVVDHIDHVARLVGVEHVGIGSDLDLEGLGSPVRPEGSPGPEGQPNFERYHAHFTEDGGVHVDGLGHHRRVFDLTEGLIRRGYGDEEIRLVLGGNWVRVLSELWS